MSKHIVPKSASAKSSPAVAKRGPGRPPKVAAPEKKAPDLSVGDRATMLLNTMVSLSGPIKVVKPKGRGRTEYTAKDGSRLPSEHGVWTRDFLRIVRRSPEKFGLDADAAADNATLYGWLQERVEEGAVEATVRPYVDKESGEQRTYVGGAIYLPGFGPQTSGAGQDARADEVLEALNF